MMCILAEGPQRRDHPRAWSKDNMLMVIFDDNHDDDDVDEKLANQKMRKTVKLLLSPPTLALALPRHLQNGP